MNELQREQARLRKQRQRDKERGNSVTLGSVTGERDIELFEGKPRFLTLSDGQVLDRANQPEPNKHLPVMIACNRANETDLSRGRSKARRIALIGRALDRTMTGLDNKPLKLGSLVRYGVSGYTFEEIGQLLT